MTDEKKTDEHVTTSRKPTDRERLTEMEGQVARLQAALERAEAERREHGAAMMALLEMVDAKLDLMVPDAARALSAAEVTELLALDGGQKFEVLEDFRGGGGSMAYRRGQVLDGKQGSLAQLIRSGVKVGLPMDKGVAHSKLTAARKQHLARLVAARTAEEAKKRLAELRAAEVEIDAKRAEAERATMQAQERAAAVAPE